MKLTKEELEKLQEATRSLGALYGSQSHEAELKSENEALSETVNKLKDALEGKNLSEAAKDVEIENLKMVIDKKNIELQTVRDIVGEMQEELNEKDKKLKDIQTSEQLMAKIKELRDKI